MILGRRYAIVDTDRDVFLYPDRDKLWHTHDLGRVPAAGLYDEDGVRHALALARLKQVIAIEKAEITLKLCPPEMRPHHTRDLEFYQRMKIHAVAIDVVPVDLYPKL